MPTADENIVVRHVQDLAESWQSKVLRETCSMDGIGIVKPKARIGPVVLSMFAHGLDAGALAILLKSVFPEFYSIGTPFLCSAGKIDKRGYVVADVVRRDNRPVCKNSIIYLSLLDMQNAFRRLADSLKLDDTERLKLFEAAKQWVVADRRLDPNMDPRDPDARRLTVH